MVMSRNTPLELVRIARVRARARGTTSIEFVIVFMMLVTAWFGLAQLSLLSVGNLIVQHAAHRAARAAIVILDDAPEHYDDTPRGQLTGGSAARLEAIRAAAYAPLGVLAPPLESLSAIAQGNTNTLEHAITSDALSQALSSVYNPIAAAVTIERNGAVLSSANDRAPITAHVAYLFHCRVPFAARILCDRYSELKADEETAKKLEHVKDPDAQQVLSVSGQYFFLLEATESLPNQIARYHRDDPEGA
jgi:TadE-like protein